jgi:3-oxoadipate enol-lactonase
MAIAKIDGLEMYYEDHGKGDALFLIPGYTCDHSFWDQMVPGLTERFRVVTFDNRGCGRTKDDGRPFSVETMAADAAALIKYLGLSHPAVLGQSMGGAIAQTMLARIPDACGKCVILNSTQSFSPGAIMALESLLTLRKADVDFDFLVDASLRWLSGSAWRSVPENVAGFKAAIRANPAPQSIADQERQLMALKTFDAGLRNKPWSHATLVVSATEDLLTPPDEGRALAASLGAKFVEIHGGHPSPIEQPERLLQILTEFLGASASIGSHRGL